LTRQGPTSSSDIETYCPESCLGCCSCVAACPVVASDGGFAGPKVLGPALSRRLDRGWPGEDALTPQDLLALGAEKCLQCHQCDLACPLGIPVSALTRRAKTLACGASAEGGPAGRGQRLLLNQDRLGPLAAVARVPRLAARALAPGLAAGLEGLGAGLLGLSPSRSLPEPGAIDFSRWLQATRRPEVEANRPPVVFYAGCHTRFYDPRAGRAAVTVLRAAGYRVVLPPQVCCGSPALSAGEEGRAVRSIEAIVRLLRQASDRLGGGVPIVSPCPTCTLTIRRTAPELLPGTEAASLATQVWDLGEFLGGPARRRLEGLLDTGPDAAASGSAWMYHTPCHLRALGAARPFPELLADLGLGRPLDLGPEADGCCGMGGFAGLTRTGYPQSLAAGARVLESYGSAARAAGAGPLVLSDCPTCRWQIADATGLDTAHPVELLAVLLETS